MYLKTMRDYLEGQASLADLDCAVSADVHPEKARAKAESELALDWDMKSIFANIPPPPVGLSAVKKALKSIPHPPQDSETHEFIQEIAALSRASYSEMPEPSGGFAQAQQRIKDKLAAAPTPVFDEQ